MFANSTSKRLHISARESAFPVHINPACSTGKPELPILQVGMAGFSQSQRQQMEGIICALPQQTVVWRVGNFTGADAWLLCGEKTRTAPSTTADDASLRVLAGLPSERALTLNLREIDRPVAFSTPLNDPDLEALFTFEPASPQSLQNVLANFERCMQQLMLKFVLGKQLIAHQKELKPTVYHVTHGGKLLAVMDFIAWKIGLLKDADPRHLESAVWEKRPIHASAIPHHFLLTDVARLRWIYAQHSARDLLPERYRSALIYFRQTPKIALSWLTDLHLQVIQELTQQPSTLADLTVRTGMPREQVSLTLSCLYYASSLTTQASHAQKALKNEAQTTDHWPSMMNSSLLRDNRMPPEPDATVAAPLRAP